MLGTPACSGGAATGAPLPALGAWPHRLRIVVVPTESRSGATAPDSVPVVDGVAVLYDGPADVQDPGQGGQQVGASPAGDAMRRADAVAFLADPPGYRIPGGARATWTDAHGDEHGAVTEGERYADGAVILRFP